MYALPIPVHVLCMKWSLPRLHPILFSRMDQLIGWALPSSTGLSSILLSSPPHTHFALHWAERLSSLNRRDNIAAASVNCGNRLCAYVEPLGVTTMCTTRGHMPSQRSILKKEEQDEAVNTIRGVWGWLPLFRNVLQVWEEHKCICFLNWKSLALWNGCDVLYRVLFFFFKLN